MTSSSLRDLLSKIKFDADLKELLRSAECPEDVVRIGNSIGYPITTDQVEDAIRSYGIPRGNLYFLLNILMYKDNTAEHEADVLAKDSPRIGSQTLIIKGTGYDLGGDEVSDQLFGRLTELEPSEYGSLLHSLELEIDESAPEFPPVLILRDDRTGKDVYLNDEISIEELGVQIEGDFPIETDIDMTNDITTQSVAKAEKLKGVWGKFELSDGEEFTPGKLLLDVRKHTLGKGVHQKVIHLCRVYYNDMDLNEDVVETTGVSIEYFLE